MDRYRRDLLRLLELAPAVAIGSSRLVAAEDGAPTDPTTFPNCDQGFPTNYITCPYLWDAYDDFFGLAQVATQDPATAAEVGNRTKVGIW